MPSQASGPMCTDLSVEGTEHRTTFPPIVKFQKYLATELKTLLQLIYRIDKIFQEDLVIARQTLQVYSWSGT